MTSKTVFLSYVPIHTLYYYAVLVCNAYSHIYYVNMQAKRDLSHCYQNVQNLSKQSNNLNFSVLILFNQIACNIVIKNKF